MVACAPIGFTPPDASPGDFSDETVLMILRAQRLADLKQAILTLALLPTQRGVVVLTEAERRALVMILTRELRELGND